MTLGATMLVGASSSIPKSVALTLLQAAAMFAGGGGVCAWVMQAPTSSASADKTHRVIARSLAFARGLAQPPLVAQAMIVDNRHSEVVRRQVCGVAAAPIV